MSAKQLNTLKEFLQDFDVQYKSGAFGKPVDDEQDVAPKTLTFDLPLFIRLLEYAREEAKVDADLHFIAANAEKMMVNAEYLTMDDYELLLGKTTKNETN